MRLVLATLALVCVMAEAKSVEHGMEKASRALKTVNKLLHLTRVHGISKVGEARDADADAEAEYEMPLLEQEMCGEWGLGGAFWEAYALVNETALEGAVCPGENDIIWTLVDRVPYVLCFMTPEERRVGFNCVEEYAGVDGAPAVMTSLQEFIDLVMYFVEPYLP